jgi:hypothetical protein
MEKTFRDQVFEMYKERVEVTLQSYVGKDNTQDLRDELKVALEKVLEEVIAEEITVRVLNPELAHEKEY